MVEQSSLVLLTEALLDPKARPADHSLVQKMPTDLK